MINPLKIVAGIVLVFVVVGLAVHFMTPSGELAVEEVVIEDSLYDELALNGDGFDEQQGISEPHWDHMPITYNVDNCGGSQISRFMNALNYISEATGNSIKFSGSSTNPDIRYTCVSGRIIEKETHVFEAAATKYNQVVRSFDPETNVLYPGEIYGYESSVKCSKLPLKEIHLVLHMLGLDHADDSDPSDMMNPNKTDCNHAKISFEDLKYLGGIYGLGEEVMIDDFAWDSLPVRYSTNHCDGDRKDRIENSIDYLEELSEMDLFVRVEDKDTQVNFECTKYNGEEDFHHLDYLTVDRPSALPEYIFEEGVIKQVNIKLFEVGIEPHQLLHSLGLVDHYGMPMTELADEEGKMSIVVGFRKVRDDAIVKLGEIYS